MDLFFESRLGMDFGFVLRNVGEVPVDGESGFVGTMGRIAGQTDHSVGHDPLTANGRGIASILPSERGPGFSRRGERDRTLRWSSRRASP